MTPEQEKEIKKAILAPSLGLHADIKHEQDWLSSIIYHENRISHREDGPSVQTWYPNGQFRTIEYHILGKLQRNPQEGFAYASWNPDGSEASSFYAWDDKVVDANFIPPHLRPQPDGLGRIFW